MTVTHPDLSNVPATVVLDDVQDLLARLGLDVRKPLLQYVESVHITSHCVEVTLLALNENATPYVTHVDDEGAQVAKHVITIPVVSRRRDEEIAS